MKAFRREAPWPAGALRRTAVSVVGFVCLLSGLLAQKTPQASAHGLQTDLLTEVVVPAGADYVVMDMLDGVEARYRGMDSFDWYNAYSCAGFVKAYYEAVYGVYVLNLTDAGPPHPEDFFTQVSVPQKGDIIFYPSPPSRNNHSAIVKAFDGERIVLIEQNYKWAQGGGTYTYVNRTIPYPPNTAEPYEIWRLRFVQDETPEETPDNTAPGETEPDDTEAAPTDTEPGETEAAPGETAPADTAPDDTEPADIAPGETAPDEADTTPEAEQTWPVFMPEEDEGYPDSPGEIEGPEEPEEPDAPEEPAQGYYETVVYIGREVMTVNGAEVFIDAPALIENNRTIMPVRWVSYAFGLREQDIFWDEPSQTVIIRSNDDIILFGIGSTRLYVNGAALTMDCPALIRHDRAYLPVRFLADALGIAYQWDDAQKRVIFYRS